MWRDERRSGPPKSAGDGDPTFGRLRRKAEGAPLVQRGLQKNGFTPRRGPCRERCRSPRLSPAPGATHPEGKPGLQYHPSERGVLPVWGALREVWGGLGTCRGGWGRLTLRRDVPSLDAGIPGRGAGSCLR